MIELLIGVALLQTGDPCHAVPQGQTARSCPLWRSAFRNARFEIFANPASVVRTGGTFEISLRIVYAADVVRRTRSAVARHRYDCAARTSVMLHITTYDAAGAVVEDRDALSDENAPLPAPPGSPSAVQLAAYCPR